MFNEKEHRCRTNGAFKLSRAFNSTESTVIRGSLSLFLPPPLLPVFIVSRPFKLLRVTVSKRAVARADAPASRPFLPMDVYSRRGWSRENRRLCVLPKGMTRRDIFLSDCFRAVIESMRGGSLD